MVAPIQDAQLPVVLWSVGNNFIVRSIKNGLSRQFQLVQPPTILARADLVIGEPGRCVQEWNRRDADHDINVKMFATIHKTHVYFVVTDVAHREIAVYSDSLNEDQWQKRLHKEEPDLERYCFWRIFSAQHLPTSIGWNETAVHLPEVWKKSHEKSEVGLSRIHKQPMSQKQCEDRVLYAVHAEFDTENAGLTVWSRAQVIERTEDGQRQFRGELLSIGTQESLQAIIPEAPSEAHQERIDRLVLGLYKEGSDGFYRLLLYEPSNRDMYLAFMPGQDLATATGDTIRTFFQERCLRCNGKAVEAKYRQESIQVTKEMHLFRRGVTLPAIRIYMKRAWIWIILNSIDMLLPRVTEAREQQEKELYGKIDKGRIGEAVFLAPEVDDQRRVEGLCELNRAHASMASVDVFLSFNRLFGEVHVDRRLFWHL